MFFKKLIISLLTLCTCILGVNASDIRANVEFLAGNQTCGRASGSLGNQKAAFYIISSFRGAKLLELSGSLTHSFKINGNRYVGHNIIGLLDTNPKSHPDKYVVVGAHFDGLGTLLDTSYPCADANASGTAVLLQLAKNFSRLIDCGRRLNYNVIFVAFDGYHEELAGSKAFWEALRNGKLVDPVTDKAISPNQIQLMVDLCQLGGFEPPVVSERKDYLIILGENSLPEDKTQLFHTANCMSGNELDLYMNFYGSEKFTQTFYKMGDRKLFIKAGIPTLFFTSGLSSLTFSRNDTAESLDYPNLEKRGLFIFNYLFLYLNGN